jgi:hypothetical protein
MLEKLNNPWLIALGSGFVITLLSIVLNRIFNNEKESMKSINKKIYGWNKDNNDNNDGIIINSHNNEGDNYVSLNIHERNKDKENKNESQNEFDLNQLKKIVNILFVDDDVNFNIVKILKKQGWINTKIITDIVDLDKYRDVHIFFIDINGVGKKMQLKDEGMGLAYCLKNKFKDKKVVIYSSDTNRDMSHPVFREVDGVLPKDAQVYEFTNCIEQFSREIKF